MSIQDELEGGWIFSVKKLVSAEIFTDFLEMAEHLLTQKYKDAAAVMIGSVLEENLRHLSLANDIEIHIQKGGKDIPKKAEGLNSDLLRSEIYGKLDQKAITMWLDIRNKAAHGRYDEYSEDQVVMMLQGVTEFLAKNESIKT